MPDVAFEVYFTLRFKQEESGPPDRYRRDCLCGTRAAAATSAAECSLSLCQQHHCCSKALRNEKRHGSLLTGEGAAERASW